MLLRGQLRYMRSSHILVRLQIKRRRQSPSASGNRLGEPCEFGDIVYGTQPNVRALDTPPAAVSHIIRSWLYKFDQTLRTCMGLLAFLPGPAITCYARQLLFDM